MPGLKRWPGKQGALDPVTGWFITLWIEWGITGWYRYPHVMPPIHIAIFVMILQLAITVINNNIY